MKKDFFVIFGGKDREEAAARKVCEEAGVATTTATLRCVPVHAGNAYEADGYLVDTGYSPYDETEAILFECGDGAAGRWPKVHRCDHHVPGDPGYGLGPEKFWEASSIGQLCILLGVEPTEELLMVAAGDHCPAAAYQGLCPGIDVESFKAFRIAGLSETSEEAGRVQKDLAFATALIRVAPESPFPGVKDLRPYGAIRLLPEAAMIAGLAYLSAIPDTDRDGAPSGNIKVNLGGDNAPDTVSAVIDWLNALPNGVTPAYGVPVRGLAGRVFAAYKARQ